MADNKSTDFKKGIENLVAIRYPKNYIDGDAAKLLSKMVNGIHSKMMTTFREEQKSKKDNHFHTSAQNTLTKTCGGLKILAISEAQRQFALLETGNLKYDNEADMEEPPPGRSATPKSPRVSKAKKAPDGAKISPEAPTGAPTTPAVAKDKCFVRGISKLQPLNVTLDTKAKEFLSLHLFNLAEKVATTASSNAKKGEVLPKHLKQSLSGIMGPRMLKIANSEGTRCITLYKNSLIKFKPKVVAKVVKKDAAEVTGRAKAGKKAAVESGKTIPPGSFAAGIQGFLSKFARPCSIDTKGLNYLESILLRVANSVAEQAARTCESRNLRELGSTELHATVENFFPDNEVRRHALSQGSVFVTHYANGLILYDTGAAETPKPPKEKVTKRKSKSKGKKVISSAKKIKPAVKKKTPSKKPTKRKRSPAKEKPSKKRKVTSRAAVKTKPLKPSTRKKRVTKETKPAKKKSVKRPSKPKVKKVIKKRKPSPVTKKPIKRAKVAPKKIKPTVKTSKPSVKKAGIKEKAKAVKKKAVKRKRTPSPKKPVSKKPKKIAKIAPKIKKPAAKKRISSAKPKPKKAKVIEKKKKVTPSAPKKPKAVKPPAKKTKSVKPPAKKVKAIKPPAKKTKAVKPPAKKLKAVKPPAKKAKASKPSAKKTKAVKPPAKKPKAVKPPAKKAKAAKPSAKKTKAARKTSPEKKKVGFGLLQIFTPLYAGKKDKTKKPVAKVKPRKSAAKKKISSTKQAKPVQPKGTKRKKSVESVSKKRVSSKKRKRTPSPKKPEKAVKRKAPSLERDVKRKAVAAGKKAPAKKEPKKKKLVKPKKVSKTKVPTQKKAAVQKKPTTPTIRKATPKKKRVSVERKVSKKRKSPSRPKKRKSRSKSPSKTAKKPKVAPKKPKKLSKGKKPKATKPPAKKPAVAKPPVPKAKATKPALNLDFNAGLKQICATIFTSVKVELATDVLKQIGGILEETCNRLIVKSVQDAQEHNSNELDQNNVRNATLAIFPEELAQHALSRGENVLMGGAPSDT